VTGRRTQQVFRLAQEVEVLLSEANPVTGGMVFNVLVERPAASKGKRGTNASGKRPRFS